MELRHLRYFVAVAEHLNFGRAADALVTAQPSLSRQIAQLEDELGIRLFDRTNRHVELTPAGRMFLVDARRTLESADAGVRHARENAEGTRGELRVAYLSGAMLVHLPRILRAYRAKFPDVTVTPEAMPVPEHLPALRAGKIDVAWTVPSGDPDIVSQTIAEEWLLAALPDGHPLGDRKEIAIGSFRDDDLIVLARNTAQNLHDLTLDVCLASGYRPPNVREVRDEMSVLGLVAAGFGIALTPYSWSKIHIEGLTFRPLTNPTGGHSVLSWHRDHARPIIRSFVATAVETTSSSNSR